MTINNSETGSSTPASLLPGILAAGAMIAFAIVQVVGMLAYNWRAGGTFLMLVVGGFVYLATTGYQRWKAQCHLAKDA